MSKQRRTFMLGFDSPVDRGLMREWVAGLGADVVESIGDTAEIDLVLMDSITARRLMDKAFGLKREAKYFLPLLVCTGAVDDVGRWLKAGFDDVLRLPATKDEWKARIDIMLRLRRQSEELGRKSEYLHRMLIESSSDHIFMLDADGVFVTSNDRVAYLGLDRGEKVVGKAIEQVFSREVAAFYREQFQRVLSEGESVVCEHDLPSSHGSYQHLDTLYPVNLPDGTVMVGGICRDITERKEAEDALRKREAALTAAEKIASLGHWEFDHQENVVRWSDEVYRIFEIDPTQSGASYESFLDVVHPDDRELVSSAYAESVINKTSYCIDHRILLKDGRIKHVHGQCNTVYDEQGNAIRSLGTIQDITDRIRAEEDRRVLETAINNAQECILVSDRDNRLTYVNRAFRQLTGYSAAEALGNTPGMLKSGRHDRAFYRNLKNTIYAGRAWQGNLTLRKKSGEFYDAYVTITPICDQDGIPAEFVSVHRDVTRERQLEQRIQQNQRLEAIGTLAGGVAHDFNNLLSPIMGYTELCMYDLPAGSKVREDLEEVMRAARRATDLVRQILSFSRRTTQERKPLLLAPIIKEALKLLRASIPVSIEIRQDIADTAEAVVADPTEIHQIVMNLCTNAFHAMPDGGALVVTLETVELDPVDCAVIPDCKPGRYLNLSVEDSGQGIGPEIRDKIFEPYFTTKTEGRGTGLGLAVTHSIVAACGGAITVSSEPGEGTRFSLYFPVAGEVPAEEVQQASHEEVGHERILFVDDDAAIVALGRRTLERYGYSVTASTDPVHALEQFRKAPTDFDLAITDVAMPRMTGDRLAEAMLEIRPDLPVIVCTGFSERMNHENARGMGVRRLLDKPVAPGELLATIREILDREE